MIRQVLPAALPLLVALTSCSKDTDKAQNAPSASTAASVAAHDDSPKSVSKKEPKPIAATDKATTKTYAAAIADGRAATKAKKYDAAIAAFDKALARVPGDARALAERGYVHFLAKHLDLAQKDLDRAVASTNDASVLGPAYYNLGLVAEARGNGDEARIAFTHSNSLKPTKAAKAKLEGKSTCVAAINRPDRKAKIVASVSDAYDAMKAAWTSKGYDPELSPMSKPTGDDAIRKVLCATDKCTGSGPWLAAYPDSLPRVSFAVVPTADKKLAVYELGIAENAGCGTSVADSIVKTGPFLQVHEELTILGREWVDEKGNSCSPSSEEDSICLNPCGPVAWEAREYILDTTAQTVAVAVDEEGDLERGGSKEPTIKPTVVVKESDGKVSVHGGGCSSDIDLHAAK